MIFKEKSSEAIGIGLAIAFIADVAPTSYPKSNFENKFITPSS
jgi:hypothetical protein